MTTYSTYRLAPASGRPQTPPAEIPEVDLMRWPDVARVPGGPVRAAVARQLLRSVARRLALRVELPGGRLLVPAPESAPTLRLHRPADFDRRVGAGGLIGFGESYQAGDWDSPDLVALLTALASSPGTLVPPRLQGLRRWHAQRTPAAELSSEENARRNIQRHYDLSNDLFALFLDPTMTYSAALFPTDLPILPRTEWDGLRPAQHRKIDRLLDLAGVGAGSRVLEIGTGWGSWRCGPPGAARTWSPSPSPRSSATWPGSGSPRPGTATGWTSGSATTAPPRAATTPWSASR